MQTLRAVVLRSLAVALVATLGDSTAAEPSSELAIRNTAIQRTLMDALFIDEGRHFLLPQTACQFGLTAW